MLHPSINPRPSYGLTRCIYLLIPAVVNRCGRLITGTGLDETVFSRIRCKGERLRIRLDARLFGLGLDGRTGRRAVIQHVTDCIHITVKLKQQGKIDGLGDIGSLNQDTV